MAETLRIYVTNDVEENLNYNFNLYWLNLLNIWKQRNLTINGKIT